MSTPAFASSGVLQPPGISNAIRLAPVGWARTLAGEVAGIGGSVNCLARRRIATDHGAELDQARVRRAGIALDQVKRQSRAAVRDVTAS